MVQFEHKSSMGEHTSTLRQHMNDRGIGLRDDKEGQEPPKHKISEDALTLDNINNLTTYELPKLKSDTKERLLNNHFFSVGYDIEELDQALVESFVAVPDCQTAEECQREINHAQQDLYFHHNNIDELAQNRNQLTQSEAFLNNERQELLKLLRQRVCEAQAAIWKQDKIIRALTARMEKLEAESAQQ